MESDPSQFTDDPNRPVESVSWNDAQEFIAKLNATEPGATYRLPTEAEWEYAARAGSTAAYAFGDDAAQLDAYAWYADNAGNIHPSGGREAAECLGRARHARRRLGVGAGPLRPLPVGGRRRVSRPAARQPARHSPAAVGSPPPRIAAPPPAVMPTPPFAAPTSAFGSCARFRSTFLLRAACLCCRAMPSTDTDRYFGPPVSALQGASGRRSRWCCPARPGRQRGG